ncbi:MAG TPA: cbb3-type cytochrome oxidase assembly protein CcoS [Eoetvoesiella sp.]|uniref:cbb3-type cytochrome oxidase assembly protein CcoS n=1 Tax=Eoetvoesiella sp. TaxID=1966355 RepID=UPI002B679B9C|nr:cbb3-type cytochrome oxidase assembly protein CcoS [Eoetvoesiella sp.]HWK61640.1 cbb3-type cytochrome oxidase assembly protein CcoS [Eoetvoesiella sp.]
MDAALYLLLPISLVFALGIGVAFWWAIFAGQFDDTDTAAKSILGDDDGPRLD